MGLTEKMFSRSSKTCPLRSDCRSHSDKRYFESLFDAEWEVFVIKRDSDKDSFDWFTLCCEGASTTSYDQTNVISATCC